MTPTMLVGLLDAPSRRRPVGESLGVRDVAVVGDPPVVSKSARRSLIAAIPEGAAVALIAGRRCGVRRLEAAPPTPGRVQPDRTNIGQHHLRPDAVAAAPAHLPHEIAPSHPKGSVIPSSGGIQAPVWSTVNFLFSPDMGSPILHIIGMHDGVLDSQDTHK